MSSLYLREDLDSVEPGAHIALGGAEARHAITVARLRVGEPTSIGNGRGLLVSGPVLSIADGELVLEASAVRFQERPSPAIVLAQALAKGGRDELAVQAATELGVDSIVPFRATRSISRWEGVKRERGRERWASIAAQAAKQSIRAWLPTVDALENAGALASRASAARVLVLEPAASQALTGIVPDGRDIVLVVGPEGGIEAAEHAAFAAAGAETVRLGTGVLRTSTAGPAAIAVLNAALGRW